MTRNEMTIREAEAILLLVEPYDLDDLSKCYRNRAKHAHPDLGGTQEEMQQVNQAYDCLKVLFNENNSHIKRSPLPHISDEAEQQTSTRIWDTDDIPPDFMDFIEELERIRRQEEHKQKVNEYVKQTIYENNQKGAEENTNKTEKQDKKDSEQNEATIKFKEKEDENTLPVLTRFRRKLSHFFLKLTHIPYGIITFILFEWHILSSERVMTSMFDGIGILFDIAFEALLVAPIVAFIIRSIIRAVLEAIARALAR